MFALYVTVASVAVTGIVFCVARPMHTSPVKQRSNPFKKVYMGTLLKALLNK